MRFFRALNVASERFSLWVTRWTGSTFAFLLSVLLVLIWLFTGPFYRYSDTWQLVANTATTLIEFMMIFVLQRTQNKDTDSMHKKLDSILERLDANKVKLEK